MLVKVVDLMPNPYRNLERYPIDRQKVDDLKSSINETSFWDNLIARPSPTEPGKYEIAYGHHRILALHELSIEEVDIPIKDFNDVTMLKIMANENMTAWATTPSVVNETVLAVRTYLNGELKKYEKLKDAKDEGLIDLLDLNESERDYQMVRAKGVGQALIHRFLGGSWKQWMIQEALAAIKQEEEGVLDREAAEQFETVAQAQEFRKEVVEKGVPVEKQKVIAQQVVKSKPKATEVSARVEQAVSVITPQMQEDLQEEPTEIRGFESVQEVAEALAEQETVTPPPILPSTTLVDDEDEKIKPRQPPDLMDAIKETSKSISVVTANIRKIKPYLQHLDSSFWRGEFYFEISILHKELGEILEQYQPQEEEESGEIVQIETQTVN